MLYAGNYALPPSRQSATWRPLWHLGVMCAAVCGQAGDAVEKRADDQDMIKHRHTILPHRRRFWLSSCLAVWIALWTLAPVRGQEVEPSRAAQAKISSALQTELAETSGPVEFLVILQTQPDAAVLAAPAAVPEDASPEARRVAKLAQVYETLTRQASQSQAGLRAWRDAQGIPYRPFYLVNMIWVQGDSSLAAALAERPDVDRLAANPRDNHGTISYTHEESGLEHDGGEAAFAAYNEGVGG